MPSKSFSSVELLSCYLVCHNLNFTIASSFCFGSQQIQQPFLLRNIQPCLKISSLASWLSCVLADHPVHAAGGSALQGTVWSECLLRTSTYLLSAFTVSEIVFSVIIIVVNLLCLHFCITVCSGLTRCSCSLSFTTFYSSSLL